jgi:hypothetical protein
MTVLRRHYETHVLGYDLVLALVFSAIVIVVIEQL